MNYLEIFQNFSEETINDLINPEEPQEEGLNLDFKIVSNIVKDNKRNYGKALSGFANSGGGVIIWGIKTTKIGNIDYASELKPIIDVENFLNSLKSWEKDLVKPIVENVEHKIVKGSNYTGFIITFIPSSDSSPHMSCAPDEHKYYKRNGDRFIFMQHFEVEDMYKKIKKPKLEIECHFIFAGSRGGYKPGWIYLYNLHISLINKGGGAALFPYLSINMKSPKEISKYGVDGNNNYNLPPLQTKTTHKNLNVFNFGSTNEFAIHPEMCLDVCYIKMESTPNYDALWNIEFDYTISANDMKSVSGTISYKEELKDILKNSYEEWERNKHQTK
ncbi:MAG: ATP-binding protein [Ignavibacteria bacterium]|nr:ATP-binding protein [Ignavibacteria bacterium]